MADEATEYYEKDLFEGIILRVKADATEDEEERAKNIAEELCVQFNTQVQVAMDRFAQLHTVDPPEEEE